MTQEATLAWLRQFECEPDAEEYNFEIDKIRYDVPTRQISMFHSKIQNIIGPNRKCIREKIPDVTPAYFNVIATVDNGVMDDEVVKTLAITGLTSVLAVQHREGSNNGNSNTNNNNQPNGLPDSTTTNNKLCIVLRSPVYTDEDGSEVESLLLLYPRLLVSRVIQNGTSPLLQAKDSFINAFEAISDVTDGGLVQWDPRTAIRNGADKIVLHGCSTFRMFARTFYKAYDYRGEELEIEEVFSQKERSLPGTYLYSFNRLSRRMEQVGELPPNLQKIDELLQMLSNDRFTCNSDLLAVAQAIFHESDGSADGELMLEELLGSNEKAHELWCTVETLPVRYTVTTLRYMASVDNPQQFKRLTETEAKPHFWKSTGPHGSDQDVAKVMKQLYGHLFAYSDAEEKWYIYDQTHWETGDKKLREKLRDELVVSYEGLFEIINGMPHANDAERRALDKRKDMCTKWIQILGTDAGKKKVMKEAADLFAVDDMQLRLDGSLSYNTFAFKDLVFNLVPEDPEKSSYSRGRPEDWCKRFSPLLMKDRITKYNMDHPEVKILLDYLRQVLSSYDINDVADDSVLWYVIDRLACCLEGGNRLKMLTLWHGPMASNSKSTLASIAHRGFGSYSATIPMAKVVGKKKDSGDGPTPALSHAQGARVVWLSEASKGVSLDAQTLLTITSGLDTLTLRDPHSKTVIEVIPSYKLVGHVNNVPVMNTAEAGLIIRVRIAMFISQFLLPDKVPKTPEEQRQKRKYPIIAEMEKTITKMIGPLMWLLTQRYKISGKYGPSEPKIIEDYVRAYHVRNDVFLRFMNDSTEEVDGSSVNLESLYISFTDWFKRKHPGRQNESEDTLNDWLIKKYGEPQFAGVWQGIRLKPKVRVNAGNF